MEREKLEQAFNLQITSELKLYKMVMLQKTKQEIIASAYQIANMIELYEALVELCPQMTEKELLYCLQIPNILTVVYGLWLKIPDVLYQEKEHAIWSFIGRNMVNAA